MRETPWGAAAPTWAAAADPLIDVARVGAITPVDNDGVPGIRSPAAVTQPGGMPIGRRPFPHSVRLPVPPGSNAGS
ncbi:MAG TPA: hypothetical protein VJ757_10870 [Pseudonocardiaceae bacterium]|nr:hypothetical protein [Pseudonocardiaceae bacterium]